MKWRKYIGLLSLGLLLFVVVFYGCSLFPESSFQLADESRLPKWVQVPDGAKRSELSLTMDYLIFPWGRRARFTLEEAGAPKRQVVTGTLKCYEPIRLMSKGQYAEPGYPA